MQETEVSVKLPGGRFKSKEELYFTWNFLLQAAVDAEAYMNIF